MKSILFCLAIIVMSSCSQNLKYFTEDLYDKYDWSNTELRRIQFYVSQDIILYRGNAGRNTRIKDGQIRLEDQRQVEEIVIKKGTPGVFLNSPQKNHFAISFEDDHDNYLMFGPNNKAEGRFLLMAKKWDSNSGEITYGGQVYETTSESAYSALMVDIKRAKKTKYRTKTADGQRVRR